MNVDTDIDDDGFVRRGTYAISTVSIGGSKAGGVPFAVIDSAVCDSCGGWATDVIFSGHTTADRAADFFHARVSRRIRVTVYACQEHLETLTDALLDEYGHTCTNRADSDELAEKVASAAQGWANE